MCEQLKGTNTLVIITADHGHLQSERIDLLADKKLCDFLSQTTSRINFN